MSQEIERKWLLNDLPQIVSEGAAKADIRQGYLITDNGELRIRAKNAKYFMTAKGEGDLSRHEWETEIPEWVFELLWNKARDCSLEKSRFTIPYGDLFLEIDDYKGRLAGMVIIEIEFSDEAQAQIFDISKIDPSACEVTYDKRFKNKQIAAYLNATKNDSDPAACLAHFSCD